MASSHSRRSKLCNSREDTVPRYDGGSYQTYSITSLETLAIHSNMQWSSMPRACSDDLLKPNKYNMKTNSRITLTKVTLSGPGLFVRIVNRYVCFEYTFQQSYTNKSKTALCTDLASSSYDGSGNTLVSVTWPYPYVEINIKVTKIISIKFDLLTWKLSGIFPNSWLGTLVLSSNSFVEYLYSEENSKPHNTWESWFDIFHEMQYKATTNLCTLRVEWIKMAFMRYPK